MSGVYEIFEKSPDGKLVFVEKAEGLEQAKIRFFFLALSSQREYVVWDPTRGHEVVLRTVAHA
jgi:hypothetical protein